MIIPNTTMDVQAAEFETRFLSIRRLNDGVAETYEVKTDGENVYIGVGDLIDVVGYAEKVIDMTDGNINQIILTKKTVDRGGFDQDIKIYPKGEKIYSAWYGEDDFKGCLNLEEGVYLDVIEIFNYLRVKAEVIDNELLVNVPVYSILDFLIYDYKSVLSNSVSQLDLLEENEKSSDSGWRDALRLACNNFDYKLLIPFWGSTEIKDEQYIKALQTLNEDDEVFYSDTTSEYMKNELSDRGLKGVLASGEDLANVLSIGGTTVEKAEEILNTSKATEENISKYMELINWNGKEYDSLIRLRAWSEYAGKISDTISLADIVVSAYETYTRADSWNQSSLNDLEVLCNLDINNYGEHKDYVKSIKKIADKCYKDRNNKGGAVAEQAAKDVSSLLLEKVVTETSVYGQVVDYFILAVNTGVSVAKCFGNIAEEMDKAELSYMVTCLINVAVASRIDAEIEYDKLNLFNMQSGEVTKCRNAIRTSIKSNLRCWSYIYYLNSDGEWENTYRGKDVKDKINKMNTYLTLLDESAQYDYTLDNYDLITFSSKKIIDILMENKYENIEQEYQEFLEAPEYQGRYYAILNCGKDGIPMLFLAPNNGELNEFNSLRELEIYTYIDNMVTYVDRLHLRSFSIWYFDGEHVGADSLVRDENKTPHYGIFKFNGTQYTTELSEQSESTEQIKFIRNGEGKQETTNKVESVYANIENASSPPLTSTLTVLTDSGQKWEVVFDDCTEYDGSGVAGRVFLADLNGDEQSEIIVDLGVIGSTYGATYVRVFTIENEELIQILDLSDDNIQEFDSEVYNCVGAEYQEGGYLKVTGLVPGVDAINSTRKDILIRWDGTDWINCS